ncbi:hypothetical protein LEP3755_51030 [Leptolyngbya sp. NIES-3755]|nr:hypothetical protein LEP3755_51030 [Leptolyngbya sp. NIES-3755]
MIVVNQLVQQVRQSVKTNRSLWLATFLLIPIALLATAFWTVRADMRLYYNYSSQIAQGQIPYRDFPVEYPPLALLQLCLPQLFRVGSDEFFRHLYYVIFAALNVILCGITAVLVAKMAQQQSKQDFRRTIALFSLLVVLNAAIILCRFDMLPALLTALAVWCVTINRPGWAGISIGLGIMTKLYPIVLLPVLGLYYLTRRQYVEGSKFLGGSVLAVAVSLLPFLPIGLGNLLVITQYHQARGIQLESISAGLLLLARQLGWVPVDVVINYGAFHLVTPVAAPILKALPFVFLGTWSLAVLSCFKRFQLERRSNYATIDRTLMICSMLVLLTFVVSSKVFSPQYLVWLLPFAPFLRTKQARVFIVICGLTLAIFPFLYDSLIELQLFPVLLLNVRNFAIVGLTAWLIADPFLRSFNKSEIEV